MMTQDNLDLATLIRKNAKKILKLKQVDSIINEMGDLFYTGSYALDLMTWNDIDMQIILKEGVDSAQAFNTLFNLFGKDPDFIEAQVIHFRGNYKPKMPRGTYLGIKLNCQDFGGIWKLDFWSLSKTDFESNRILIETLHSKLNPQNREIILDFKHEMMAGASRVPQMGSHLLYQAVLLEGITKVDALYTYLANHGIYPVQHQNKDAYI